MKIIRIQTENRPPLLDILNGGGGISHKMVKTNRLKYAGIIIFLVKRGPGMGSGAPLLITPLTMHIHKCFNLILMHYAISYNWICTADLFNNITLDK